MREILIDWLVQVQMKYQLRTETLFLTIHLIDCYLSRQSINRKNLQLVGVAGMFIASKYEEIYPPTVDDFVYLTDSAYRKEDVLQMERDMLVKLDFNVHFTSAFRFLERFMQLKGSKELERNAS